MSASTEPGENTWALINASKVRVAEYWDCKQEVEARRNCAKTHGIGSDKCKRFDVAETDCLVRNLCPTEHSDWLRECGKGKKRDDESGAITKSCRSALMARAMCMSRYFEKTTHR